MKKLNNKGFVMAETLIVSVFLMVIFTMIYSNFYPIIGEYEKRENYDDVDGKYTAYWIKKIIESDAYIINPAVDVTAINMMNKLGYIRFECKDVTTNNNQRDMCINLVTSLEISECDSYGNGCDIFITRYKIGDYESAYSAISFKDTVRNRAVKRWNEKCINSSDPFNESNAIANSSSCATKEFKECCRQKGLSTCTIPVLSTNVVDYETLYSDSEKTNDKDNIAKYCNNRLAGKSFKSQVKDYILSLPNYSIYHGSTNAKYRVIVIVHHQKDNNNYYSFSTMEVIK